MFNIAIINSNENYWGYFLLFSGSLLSLHTSTNYDTRQHHFSPLDYYLEFRVKACREVHIGLMVNNSVVYRFVIGYEDNQKSTFRMSGMDKAVTDTPGILHCDYYRRFWTRWASSRVPGTTMFELGTGEVGSQRLLHYYEPSVPQQKYRVSLSTANGAAGEFLLKETQGIMIVVQF